MTGTTAGMEGASSVGEKIKCSDSKVIKRTKSQIHNMLWRSVIIDTK